MNLSTQRSELRFQFIFRKLKSLDQSKKIDISTDTLRIQSLREGVFDYESFCLMVSRFWSEKLCFSKVLTGGLLERVFLVTKIWFFEDFDQKFGGGGVG